MIPRRRIAVDAGSVALAWLEALADPAAAVERFERTFAAWTGRRFAVTACSGRAALLAALRATGAGEGSEVILPAYTLADLPAMLKQAGMIPVFADVDPETYLIDAADVARAITPRTRAILPTDLFGFAARWGDLLGDLSRTRGVPLIEDAAHAAGSLLDGAPVGSGCRIAFFSLETIKMMHSFGGGVVVTDEEDLAASIRRRLSRMPPPRGFVPKKFIRNLVENLAFRTPVYQAALMARGVPRIEVLLLSFYDRVKHGGVLTEHAYSGWQASFARRQLDTLTERVHLRRRVARQLMSVLEGYLVFPDEPPGLQGNRYFLVGRTDRDPRVIRMALVRAGVDIGSHGEITDFCPPESERNRYPNANRAHRRLLQLPLYDAMTPEEIDRIASAVRRAIERAPSRVDSA